jgi:hypothetical protein
MIDTPQEVVSNPLNALRREFLSCARHSALFMHVLALALGVLLCAVLLNIVNHGRDA